MDRNNRIKLAISPCPNDTYIFGAWINNYLDDPIVGAPGCEYMDIQELNEQALKGNYDVIKFSAALLPKIADRYWISETGSAAGFDTGPLLVARNEFDLKDLPGKRIALPGKDTTAAFLFQFLFPEAKQFYHCIFSEIENKILDGTVEAGVIIHESRFNFKQKDLVEIADLGHLWVEKTGNPIPLGLIGIRKTLEKKAALQIQTEIRKSLEYARKNEEILKPFIQQLATDMTPEVIQKHIQLYVNQFTNELGFQGKAAILSMFNNDSHQSLSSTSIFI